MVLSLEVHERFWLVGLFWLRCRRKFFFRFGAVLVAAAKVAAAADVAAVAAAAEEQWADKPSQFFQSMFATVLQNFAQ